MPLYGPDGNPVTSRRHRLDPTSADNAGVNIDIGPEDSEIVFPELTLVLPAGSRWRLTSLDLWRRTMSALRSAQAELQQRGIEDPMQSVVAELQGRRRVPPS